VRSTTRHPVAPMKRRKRVGILLFDGVEALDFIGPGRP
jgi:hypothetical protein